MRIAINARILASTSLRGWNRYTVNLLSELSHQNLNLFLYTDQALHAAHLERLAEGSYQLRVAKPMRYPFWEQVWLPQQCAADRIDILHSPFNFGLPWRSRCRRVLTLHDAIDSLYTSRYQNFQERWRKDAMQNRVYSWAARARAHHIITVSQHARQDLEQGFGIHADRISVTPEAAERKFHEPISEASRNAVRRNHELTKPYFFYIGGWEDRKNLPFLLRAFAAANLDDVELVLGGGNGDQKKHMIFLAESLGIGKRLRLIDWVDDQELPALYGESLAFVYPSKYEGFGLQLCEAMAVGVPVLAANRTSLPEVLGDGGETFGLENHQELTNYLRHISTCPEYREELCIRSKARGNMFNWRHTAEATLKVYDRLLSIDSNQEPAPCKT